MNTCRAALVLSAVVLAVATVPAGSVDAARQEQVSPRGVPSDPSALGYLNLHKRHPDGHDGPTEFVVGYGADVGLMRLKQMQEFLTSFRALTNQVRRRLTESQRTAIGNTGADVQSIGFHNIPIVVEGTIRKQEYELAQARFELALLKRGRGEVTDAEVDRARMAYRDATRSFQTFWDTRRPVD